MDDDKGFVIFCWIAGFIVFLLVVSAFFALPAYSRYQTRATAKNNVKVSNIEIQNQAQRVKIAEQKAEIRKQDAVGVREAQDEIAKTLTPLYVQYEMIQAMEDIATSGKNNTMVFIPTGANGLPITGTVPTIPTPSP